jgi:hypothetical protein
MDHRIELGFWGSLGFELRARKAREKDANGQHTMRERNPQNGETMKRVGIVEERVGGITISSDRGKLW